jgi:O-antigen ligase
MLADRFRILGLLLFGLSWLAYDHYRPWVNFHSEALACAGALFLLTGQLLLREAPLTWPRVGWWVLLAALLAWAWWGLGISLFASDALMVSIYALALAAMVLVGFSWARGSGQWLDALAWTVALAAALSGVIGMLQWLQLTLPFGMYVVQADFGDRALGNMGQPNQLGTLLLMGMAALLQLFETRRLGRLAFGTCIAFLTLPLVLTQSRAALLSAVVVTAFLLVKGRRLQRLPLLVWAMAILVLTAAMPAISEFLLLGAGRDAEAMSRTQERIEIWRQVLAGIGQSPWWGYGWNQTPTAHLAGALHVPGSMTYGYAHNVVLDLMAWTGVPLGLLFALLIGWWLISRAVAAQEPVAVAALAGLLPLAVHSQVEFPFAYAYFLVLAGLLIGIVEAFHPAARGTELKRRWVLALVIPWTVAGVWVCHEYLLVEEDFRIVRFENLRIGQTPAAYEVPEIRLLGHMGEMLHAARMRPQPGMSPQEIERLRKVALRFPWGALHLRYAYALALNGDPAGAAHQLRVVQGMFGDLYYAAARQELLELQQRHPEVAATSALL